MNEWGRCGDHIDDEDLPLRFLRFLRFFRLLGHIGKLLDGGGGGVGAINIALALLDGHFLHLFHFLALLNRLLESVHGVVDWVRLFLPGLVRIDLISSFALQLLGTEGSKEGSKTEFNISQLTAPFQYSAQSQTIPAGCCVSIAITPKGPG